MARTASFPLAVLAANGLVDAWDAGRSRRVAAALLGALLLGGGGLSFTGALSEHAARRAPRNERVAADSDLARAHERLLVDSDLQSEEPVLVRELTSRSGRLADTLAPHPDVVRTGLALWCDAVRELSPTSSRWEGRHRAVTRLYGSESYRPVGAVTEWDVLGRPVLFLVDAADRARLDEGGRHSEVRGVELRLLRLGAELLWREGDVAVYVRGAGLAQASGASGR